MSTNPSLLPEGQIIEEFRQRRTRQWIAAIPGVIAFLIAYWALDHPDRTLFGLSSTHMAIGAFVLVAAYVLFSIRNWRCPSCEGYLGKNMNPAFCPKCGSKLKA